MKDLKSENIIDIKKIQDIKISKDLRCQSRERIIFHEKQ